MSLVDPADRRITVLDSGLTVVTEHVPATRSVAAGVWVGVGSRDEAAHESGVSHFLEHLLFKGTDRRSAQDIARAVDRCGGDINAFTTKEYTAYYCRLPVRDAAMGIELLGDVLTAPALRPDDVEVERQVILEEISMDDDSPDEVAHREFLERVFADHPLGRDTAGEPDTVSSLGAPEVRSFFERHYRAGSMVVSAAGPLSHDDLLTMIADGFAPVGRGRSDAVRTAPTSMTDGVHVDDDTEQVHLVLGGRAIDRLDPDREALDVVNHVLGGGLSSRLFEEIRERRGLVYSVWSTVGVYADTGAWSIGAGSQPKHARTVLDLIEAELASLVASGLTDDELDLGRHAVAGSFELGLEDTGSRMARNAGLLTSRGEITEIGDQVAKWLAVDHDATRRAIARVYTGDRVQVTVGPDIV
jgi:predicted Zn-dependent peptidase